MTNKVKNSEIKQQQIIIGGIVAVVVIAIGVFVALQFANQSADFDYSSLHQERTEDGGFVLGNPEAPVTLVAFEDFLCPHCQSYQSDVHEIFEQYVFTGQLRFEFRMLPIAPQSGNTFGLVECSEELKPGSFWYAHDEMFRMTSTTGFGASGPRDFAQAMGLEYGEVLDCLKDAEQYQTDQRIAGQFQEITGTPSVGWRLNNGSLRFDGISRRPNAREVGQLIERVNLQLGG